MSSSERFRLGGNTLTRRTLGCSHPTRRWPVSRYGHARFQCTKDAQCATVDVRSRLQSPCTPFSQRGPAEGRHWLDHCMALTSVRLSTAITEGRLFSEPRPALPPLHSSQAQAASNDTTPLSWRRPQARPSPESASALPARRPDSPCPDVAPPLRRQIFLARSAQIHR